MYDCILELSHFLKRKSASAQVEILTGQCFGYLLLHKKNDPNLSDLKKHLSSHNFCGSRSQEKLSWVVLAWGGFSRGGIQVLGRGCSHLTPCLGLEGSLASALAYSQQLLEEGLGSSPALGRRPLGLTTWASPETA